MLDLGVLSLVTLQVDLLAQRHYEGKLNIPGHPVPQGECPQDLLEQPPAPPRLNVCIQRSDLYPEIPDSIVKVGSTKLISPPVSNRSWLKIGVG